MNGAPAIQLSDVGKCFRYYQSKWHRISGALFSSKNHYRELWALRHINFSLQPGTTLGIIGQNGSGKTTLLQIIAGLLKPTEGQVSVEGKLATLLELGGGFQAELSGRENIFVSGGLLGFSRRAIESKVDEIIRFSELEEFIDRPIKHYSSGMLMRLAFSAAISVQPDILLIDEAFAVGDMAFQHKCTRKFRELQQRGATILLVTHDMMAVKSLCNHALLLDHGKPMILGTPEEVTNAYLNLIAQRIANQEKMEADQQQTGPVLTSTREEFHQNVQDSPRLHRHGSGEGKIRGIQILNSQMAPADVLLFGEDATFRFYIEYMADVAESGLGFYVRDKYGNDVVGINTFEEGRSLGSRNRGDKLIIEFKLPVHLKPGSYTISPGFSYHRSEPRYLDWIDSAALFEVHKPATGQEIYGFMYVPNQVSVRLVQPD